MNRFYESLIQGCCYQRWWLKARWISHNQGTSLIHFFFNQQLASSHHQGPCQKVKPPEATTPPNVQEDKQCWDLYHNEEQRGNVSRMCSRFSQTHLTALYQMIGKPRKSMTKTEQRKRSFRFQSKSRGLFNFQISKKHLAVYKYSPNWGTVHECAMRALLTCLKKYTNEIKPLGCQSICPENAVFYAFRWFMSLPSF